MIILKILLTSVFTIIVSTVMKEATKNLEADIDISGAFSVLSALSFIVSVIFVYLIIWRW